MIGHHTPCFIHTWEVEIRVWEKSSTKELRTHELTMIMRYGWLDPDEMMILDCIPSLHLPPSSPFPTFIFSLVLPYSCSFRERGRGWEMGEWNGLVLLQLRFGVFISCIWQVGPRVEWRTAHSPLTACSLVTGGWSGITSGCPMVSKLMDLIQALKIWRLGLLPLFQGLATWPMTT